MFAVIPGATYFENTTAMYHEMYYVCVWREDMGRSSKHRCANVSPPNTPPSLYSTHTMIPKAHGITGFNLSVLNINMTQNCRSKVYPCATCTSQRCSALPLFVLMA